MEQENQISALHQGLAKRFGDHRVHAIPVEDGELELLLLDLELNTPVSILMTNGLSSKAMTVPEKVQDRQYIELYFCLPSYWEWEDRSNANTNWVFTWIQRLAKHLLENETWFGDGHTIDCRQELSSTMKQNHFFLSDPILLEQELAPLQLEDKEVHFTAIIPIFPDEMDYKQGKGTLKFKRKLIQQGISEKLDDYRSTALKSKWRLPFR